MYACGEMANHMARLWEFYPPFVGACPGTVGMEDNESIFSRRMREDMIPEKYLGRHFLGIQQSIEMVTLTTVSGCSP